MEGIGDIKVELIKEPKDRFLVVSYINTVNKIERQNTTTALIKSKE
jgi:hypothetical protein